MSALAPVLHETGCSARVAFTTRTGGVSVGSHASLNLGAATGDRAERVRENRLKVCRGLGLDPDGVSMCRQVHGSGALVLAAPSRPGRFAGGLAGWPRGDALVTRAAGLPIAVLGADCLPVMMWRRDEPGVAAAHAGWRGLMAGVLEAAARALGPAERIEVVIGPGIGPSRYEVDRQLADRFAARFGEGVVRGRNVDLVAVARVALTRAGVPADRIATVPACTYDEPERWFSHRRDGAGAGRQAGIAWLEPA